MIRQGRISDYPDLDRIFRIAHRQSPFKDVPYDEQHVKRMLAMGTTMEPYFCQVVEHEGKVVGILGGCITVNILGAKVATDLITFSTRDTDKLIAKFSAWAERNGADMMAITDISGNERYRSLLKKAGLNEISAGFVRMY